MTEIDKKAFEPFVTISLAHRARQPYALQGTMAIALASNCPGVTAIHWYDAPAARKLVADLQALINVLDPPPAAPIEPAKSVRKRRSVAKVRKTKHK